MKWIAACLVAVATLGCLSDAQYYPKPKPQAPQAPQVPQAPQAPQAPQPPRYTPPKPLPRPQTPYNPQQPQQPPKGKTPATETFHSCEVAENYKIQCGVDAISSSDCEDINCCFDGRMCYYGKAGKCFSLFSIDPNYHNTPKCLQFAS